MLKYHVAVCDDEKSDLDGIVQSVQQYDVLALALVVAGTFMIALA